MKRSRRSRRLYVVPIGISLVALVAGCALSPPPYPDVAVEIPLDTTGVSVNLDSLRTQLNMFAGPVVHFSRRATCPGCIVDVALKRTGKTNDIKANDGPITPRQIAVIRNTDATDTTEMYHFEPGKEYIFQIGRDPVTHAATYSMIELPLGHTGSLRVVARGAVNMCSPHATGRSKVSFAYCSDSASDGSWVGSSMVDFVALRAAFYAAIRFVLPDGLLYERRGWFSCDSGCCTA